MLQEEINLDSFTFALEFNIISGEFTFVTSKREEIYLLNQIFQF